jgi:aminoglycoside phosphotransferase (APT) family kinase protein
VTKVQWFDVSTLSSYLEEHLEDFHGPISVHKFPQGQSNPTFRIDTSSKSVVLRRKPEGVVLKSAHAIDREYRVMLALENTDVPVPRVHHLCTDDTVIGSWFYLMEYVDGTVFSDPALPGLTFMQRKRVYDEANRVLAAIHTVDIDSNDLGDFGSTGNYYERQVSRWTKQYRFSETCVVEPMEQLMDWLPKNIPIDDGLTSLIHGDFRLDNIIFNRDNFEAIAVLDWELSTLGHPIADLAYLCMQRRMKKDLFIPGLGGLDIAELGIPDEEDFLSRYCYRTGLKEVGPWSFYLAFSFFRFSAICQGVLKRALEGNASSEYGSELGTMVEPLARLGLKASQN